MSLKNLVRKAAQHAYNDVRRTRTPPIQRHLDDS
jgi:hypothetical protein